jgi:predicted hydrocarbon binding protein
VSRPSVPIEVDHATGRWFVDGLPMILMPQHFFLNNHFAVEAELGSERLAAVLAPAGHRSAFVWCEHEAAHHKIGGEELFRHYMRRLSQRGWAQFEVIELNGRTGRATVKVMHSVFVTGRPENTHRKVCAMFAPWLQGSLEFVTMAYGERKQLACSEVYCAAEGKHAHCLFEASRA